MPVKAPSNAFVINSCAMGNLLLFPHCLQSSYMCGYNFLPFYISVLYPWSACRELYSRAPPKSKCGVHPGFACPAAVCDPLGRWILNLIICAIPYLHVSLA